MIPTGLQIREGREPVGMSQADLVTAAGVGLALIVRAELAAQMPQLTRKDSAVIQATLEGAGVQFVRGDGGVDVRLRNIRQNDGTAR